MMPACMALCRRGLTTLLVLLALGAALAPAPAHACPNCAVGREARAEFFGDDFLRNLATAALPFVIIGAVCARVQRVRRRP